MQKFQRFFLVSFWSKINLSTNQMQVQQQVWLDFLIFKAIDLCLLEFSLPPGDNYHGCGWLNCYYFGLKTQFWPVCITCDIGHRQPLTWCWIYSRSFKKTIQALLLWKPKQKQWYTVHTGQYWVLIVVTLRQKVSKQRRLNRDQNAFWLSVHPEK